MYRIIPESVAVEKLLYLVLVGLNEKLAAAFREEVCRD